MPDEADVRKGLDPALDPADVDYHGMRYRTPLYCAVSMLRSLGTQEAEYRRGQTNRAERTDLGTRCRPFVLDAYPHARMSREPSPPSYAAEAIDDLAQWIVETIEADRVAHEGLPAKDRDARAAHFALLVRHVVAEQIVSVNLAKLTSQLRDFYGLPPSNRGGRGQDLTEHIRPGDPVPACDSIFGTRDERHPRPGIPERVGSSDLGTHPRRLPRWRRLDRVESLLLAPASVGQVKVRLCFGLELDVDEIADQRRVGVALPTGRLDHFAFGTDNDRLWGVQPATDAAPADQIRMPEPPTHDGYVDMVGRSIDVARSESAQLVVLPELSLKDTMVAPITEHWQSHQTSGVLVAGSAHSKDPKTGRWTNECTVVGRRASVTLKKTIPYVMWLKGQAALDAMSDPPTVEDVNAFETSFVEDIDEGEADLVVFVGTNATVAVYICIDWLFDPLRDVGRDLDLSLVVIPALSSKLQVFRGLIAGHVAATQGVVVLGNSVVSADCGHARAIIGHPQFDQKTVTIDEAWRFAACDEDEFSRTGPGVVLFDLDAPEGSAWAPVDRQAVA